jgi:hypothetical protein
MIAVLKGDPLNKSANITIFSQLSNILIAFIIFSRSSVAVSPTGKLTSIYISCFPRTSSNAEVIPFAKIPCPVTIIPVIIPYLS